MLKDFKTMANISVNIDGLTTGNPQAVVDLMNVVNDPNNFDNVTPVDADSVEDNFDFEKAVNDTFDEIDNEQQNESVEHKPVDKKEVLDPRKNRVDPDEDAEGEEELLLEDEPKENNLVADLEKMEKEAQTAMGEVDKMFGESFRGKKALKESVEVVSNENGIPLKWTVDTDELSDEDKEFLRHFMPNTYYSDADAYEYAMDEKLPSGRWLENIKPSIVYGENDRVLKADFTGFVLPKSEGLTEDTVKQGSSWVNKGKEGTHGKFKTKKAADKQRKAMFANGYKAESVNESVNIIDEDSFVNEFERLENDSLAYGKMGEFRKIVSDFLAQENVDQSSIDWTGAYVEQLGLDKSKELIRRLRTQLLGVDESVERKGTLLTEGTSNFLMFDSPNLAFTDEECELMDLPHNFQKEELPYWYSKLYSRNFGVTPIETGLNTEFAFVGYRYGYYEGINVGIIKNDEFEEWAYNNYDEVNGTYYEYGSDTPISKEELKKEFDSKVAEEYAKGVQFLKKLNNEYGGRFINVQAQFSNGETWYGEEKLEESYRIQQQRDLLKEAKAAEDDFDDENSFEYVWSSFVNGNLTQYQEQLKKMSNYEIREYIDWAKEQGIPYEDLQLDFMYETLNPDLQYHSREGHMVKNGTTKPCHPQRTVKTINSNGKEFAGYSPKQDEIMRDKVVTIVENFKKVIEHSDEKLYPALQRRITDKLLSEGVTTKAITKIIDNLF